MTWSFVSSGGTCPHNLFDHQGAQLLSTHLCQVGCRRTLLPQSRSANHRVDEVLRLRRRRVFISGQDPEMLHAPVVLDTLWSATEVVAWSRSCRTPCHHGLRQKWMMLSVLHWKRLTSYTLGNVGLLQRCATRLCVSTPTWVVRNVPPWQR